MCQIKTYIESLTNRPDQAKESIEVLRLEAGSCVWPYISKGNVHEVYLNYMEKNASFWKPFMKHKSLEDFLTFSLFRECRTWINFNTIDSFYVRLPVELF